MTHPDDEISICAWINLLIRNGNPVFLSWTHHNPQRELEARAVAKRLGVPPKNLRFFGAPDGCVIDHLLELVPQFADWFSDIEPDRVACGAFEQGHIDHDATNYIVNRAFNGPVLEIPFYHTYARAYQTFNRFSVATGQEVRDLTPDEQWLRREIARSYPSQRIWPLLCGYEVTQRMLGQKPDLLRTERMRLQRHQDWQTPNHPPEIRARVERTSTWQRWLKAVS